MATKLIRGEADIRGTILHLAAAPPGWWARFIDRDNPESSWVSPVACWVVTVDEHGQHRVSGVNPIDDEMEPMSEPIGQAVNYFYDPAYVPTDNVSGVTDPGPGGRR